MDYGFTYEQVTATTSTYNETQNTRPYRFMAPASWEDMPNNQLCHDRVPLINIYDLTHDITNNIYLDNSGNKLIVENTNLDELIENKNNVLLKYQYIDGISTNSTLDMNKMREYLNELDCPTNGNNFKNITSGENIDDIIQYSRLASNHKKWPLKSMIPETSHPGIYFTNTEHNNLRNNIFSKINYSVEYQNTYRKGLINTTRDIYKANGLLEPITTSKTTSFRDGEVRYLVSVTDLSNAVLNLQLHLIVNQTTIIIVNEPIILKSVQQISINDGINKYTATRYDNNWKLENSGLLTGSYNVIIGDKTIRTPSIRKIRTI